MQESSSPGETRTLLPVELHVEGEEFYGICEKGRTERSPRKDSTSQRIQKIVRYSG